MPKVFKLSHIGLGTSDFSKAHDYYVEKVGLTEVERDDTGAAYLSVGMAHHDVVLHPTSGDGNFVNIGYQLNAGTDLAEFAGMMRDAGTKAERKSDAQPGVADLVEVEAPGSQILQFYGAIENPVPGFSRRGIAPLRLGHIATITPDAERLIAFYRDVLGFAVTDWIGDVATFMTCNHEHHVINILNAPVTKIHHIAFQLHENAEHPRCADFLRASGIQTEWGPSRHTAGHNLAAYHYDPDSHLIELYTDMDIYLPELHQFEPRPWHEELPMTPRRWALEQLSAWDVKFQFDLAKG
ncbi:VOC family protein [Fertoebacter nigrum]|uniref:VOC family protein n=1 Tax=Fertoeibacter niger TaxID=2656921 RepID=A0A8X8H3D4_9RHOB|nr:VOC family protein [Fertoeibacter niger]NUB46480.1 VOC family protein [Fertoeibacter niger]